jgi:hypothetical protein
MKKTFQTPNYVWRTHLVLLSTIILHSTCQRLIKRWKVNAIKRRWNPRIAQKLRCAQFPSGDIRCADGQHTGTAMIELFGDHMVEVEVTDVRDEADFAQLVLDCNPKLASNPSPNDNFWLRLEAGDAIAHELKLIVEKCGYTVGRQNGAGHRTILCVGAMETILDVSGPDGLRSLLMLLSDIFPEQSPIDYIANGTWLFLKHCGDDPAFKRDRIVEVLRQMPFPTFTRQARERKGIEGSQARAFAVILRTTFNESNPHKSPDIRSEIPQWAKTVRSKPPRD